jgi:hypothetical protein
MLWCSGELIAAAWSSMPMEGQQPFLDKAAADKKVYELAMGRYLSGVFGSACTSPPANPRKRPKRKRDPSAPKPPKSKCVSFFLKICSIYLHEKYQLTKKLLKLCAHITNCVLD